MSRAPHPTGRGAAGIIVPQQAKPMSSEHERDVWLAQQARTRLSNLLASDRMNGRASGPGLRGAFIVCKRLLRDLAMSSAWSVLSQRQREMCAKWANIAEIPPAEKTMPEVLRALPKAPPGRRT